MRVGICSFAYPWAVGVPGFSQLAEPMDAFSFLDRAKSLGAECVQYADNLPLDALSPEDLRRLKDEADAAGVRVENGIRGTEARHVLPNVEIARFFGGDFLRIMPDRGEDFPPAETIVSRLSALRSELLAADVRIALENIDRFSARELRQMVEAIGPDICGVCLDTVNSFGAGEGPEAVVDTLAPLTLNLHVKDYSVARVPSRLGFTIEGRPAGGGMLHLPALLARLPNCRSAVLEMWTPPEETIEATCEKEARWVAQSLAYLRGLGN